MTHHPLTAALGPVDDLTGPADLTTAVITLGGSAWCPTPDTIRAGVAKWGFSPRSASPD